MNPTMPRVKMPTTAKFGEVIAIKSKIRHPMETGWRKGSDGKTVPRDRITKFVCTFEGQQIMSADFDSGVAADPYLLFHSKVIGSGTYTFTWEADGGVVYTTSATLSLDPTQP